MRCKILHYNNVLIVYGELHVYTSSDRRLNIIDQHNIRIEVFHRINSIHNNSLFIRYVETAF